ncbi:hypothetical protein H2201_003729 [Coniosporium apollinis]|uniref:YAG7-like dimerisation domain-containing protein n=2 Tax=Coniosporium TaxID=2810619 RepID=A0ABQ9NYB8_9PEZI|nr:hypothetical protein H2199_005094 [Cladosporium sp. JES 115]KAJ9666051.1 hypothetical protein H2201_003729 [Coniosporium apollinis]
MSSETVSNPPAAAPTESKSARKKRAKAEAATAAATKGSEARAASPELDGKTNGPEDSSESSYIKEIQKNIRNVNKKLNLMSKVDSIIAENPGVSLDDLVSTRKINNDQKAQALKKPALQAQLAQLEEQLTTYKKIDEDYQQKMATEKQLLQSSHADELEKLRETLKAEAELESQKASKQRLLTLSRFLREAADRRTREDEESDESKAFEGALLLVYGGDANAVLACEKLIDGAEEQVPSVEGVLVNYTYAQIKKIITQEAPFAAEEAWVDDVAQAEPAAPEAAPQIEDDTAAADGSAADTTTASTSSQTLPTSDPTVVNAGLTEMDTQTLAVTNGDAEEPEAPSAPAAGSVDDGAANAAASEQWDAKASGSDDPLAESFEMVPRDPAETETAATPAEPASTQSWADDTPTEPASTEAAPATSGGDGFHEVHHARGGRGRGGFQGEHRGGYRGRGGPRGEGRGRGGFRGDRGDGFRGGRGRGGFRGEFRGGRGRGESQ